MTQSDPPTIITAIRVVNTALNAYIYFQGDHALNTFHDSGKDWPAVWVKVPALHHQMVATSIYSEHRCIYTLYMYNVRVT